MAHLYRKCWIGVNIFRISGSLKMKARINITTSLYFVNHGFLWSRNFRRWHYKFPKICCHLSRREKVQNIYIGTSNWPLNAIKILHKGMHPIKITSVLISLSTGIWRRLFWYVTPTPYQMSFLSTWSICKREMADYFPNLVQIYWTPQRHIQEEGEYDTPISKPSIP